MKITFLGTAPGLPAPKRKFSSTLIEVGGIAYLVDAGSGALSTMTDLGVDINSLRSVFITHAHLDHINGLLDLVDMINWTKTFSGASIDYYLPEAAAIEIIRNYVTTLSAPMNEEGNRFHTYFADLIYEDENIRLTPIPNGHMKSVSRPSYSFLIECGKKRVLFTGDLSQELAEGDFPSIVRDSRIDILVCELAHFDLETVLSQLADADVGAVYFTHVKQPWLRIPEIEAKAASGELKFPIYAPSDGDFIEL